MASKKKLSGQIADHGKELKSLLLANSHRHRLYTVFSDFCEMSALSISNSVDLRNRETREARYLQIVGTYERDEVNRFCEMLGHLVEWLEQGFGDRLGELYMSLDLGNSAAGQFFTPFSVSSLMAELTLVGMEKTIEQRGFLELSEPACGSGGMVIACAQAMKINGYNYQQMMHATLVDVDATAVHMAYVQCALYGIPAIVVHGNTLSMKEFGHWYTPMHVLGGWSRKRDRLAADSALAVPASDSDQVEKVPEQVEQLQELPAISVPVNVPPQDMRFELQTKLFG